MKPTAVRWRDGLRIAENSGSVRRPSGIAVVATAALFLSLGGVSLAAGHFLITSTHQIKPSVLEQIESAAKGQTDTNGSNGSNGQQGAQGQRGPQGPHGFQGSRGPRGEPGATGATGPTGAKGDPGAPGAPGSAANGYYATSQNVPISWQGSSTRTVVVSLSVPPGTYSASGSAVIDDQGNDSIAYCQMAAVPPTSSPDGAQFGSLAQGSINNAGHGDAEETLVVTGLVVVPTGSVLRLDCAANPWTNLAATSEVALAIQSYLSALSISSATGG